MNNAIKKANKLAHKVRMKIRMRTKNTPFHTASAKPRKRDRVIASASVPQSKYGLKAMAQALTPILLKEQRRQLWAKFKDKLHRRRVNRAARLS